MQLSELITALEAIAPPRLAESWDNVGLLVGDPSQSVSRVLLTIDYTAAVASEVREAGCDAIIAYHPLIFVPLKRIEPHGLIHDAIRRSIAIYSPHTALDAAPGGTNDVLADVLGLTDRRPLRFTEAKSTEYKLVTFVPREHVEAVSRAIFAAGAGRIGQYSSCSFRTDGTGTFFGEAGTQPAVGISGQLEEAAEVRLETVVPIKSIGEVIAALRAAHPYEEPAFDLNLLAAIPGKLGQGRVGWFDVPVERAELFGRIKRGLGIEHLLIAGPVDGMVTRAAVCAGSCGDLLSDAMAGDVELYLTGEMRHHDALRAAAAGITVVCTLHSNSERASLKALKLRLEQALPAAVFLLSRMDRDPFVVG